MKSVVKPIFVFSLPRAGSTLLQRVLASHQDISTTSEPWVLMPFANWDDTIDAYSEYATDSMRVAMDDFFKELPDSDTTLCDAMRGYGMPFYESLSKGRLYFLDKTPRYHLIVDRIIRSFPDAKFIFLWRNPLAVAASISKTWKKDTWDMYGYEVDLYKGLVNLVEAYTKHEKLCLSVNYENLVDDPGGSIKEISAYLNLKNEGFQLDMTSPSQLAGRMGDPTGVKEYKNISSGSEHKWVEAISNPYRRRWSERYLNWIGGDRLEVMNYDIMEYKKVICKSRGWGRFLLRDILAITKRFLNRLSQGYLVKKSLSKFLRGERVGRLS